MKVFLSYKYGDDITVIKELLGSHNVEIFDAVSDIQIGSPFHVAIKNEIKQCDFVLIVYSEINPTIAFEAGIAFTLNKPIYSILSGGDESSFLFDSTYVYAQPNESEKIKFSFELFLQNIKVKQKASTVAKTQPIYYGGGELIPVKTNFDVMGNYNLAKKSGEALELLFQEIFEEYRLNVVKSSLRPKVKKGWIPDFSIWSDELTLLLGNPILVEIKREINASNLANLEENIAAMRSHNPASSILIFYDQLKDIKASELPHSFTCLYIKIYDLVQELSNNSFAASIRKIRNQIVHQH